MITLSRFLAALRAPSVTKPAPESPRYSNPVWPGQFGFIPSTLAMTVDQQLAVSVAWACIRAIVDPIAASEIKVYEERKGKRVEDKDGWMYWLMNVEPHPQYTAQGWIEVMGTRAVATGNSYAFLQRDGSRKPISMQPLDPARMRAEDNGSGGVLYLYSDPTSGTVEMPESEVIHIRGPRTGGFYGDSGMIRGAASMALARAQEEYATSYYANGAYPGVLLKPPSDMKAAPTKADKASLRDVWRALFGGPRNANGLATLDPGWDLEVIDTDAQKSQVVEARRYQVAEICRYFGVPGHLVGVPEAAQGYGKNLAELGIGFVRYTLEPWCRRIEEEFRRKLMPQRREGGSWFIEYDLERLKQGDAESVARAAEIDLRNGVLTINEARALRGLPSVKNGDHTLINGKPLDQVLEPPKPPPAPFGPRLVSPPDDDESEDRDEPEKPIPADAAASVNTRPALTAILDRHLRRARARTADLVAKGKADTVEEHVERLRVKACAEVLGLDPSMTRDAIRLALVSVEQGAPPDKAAAHLLGAA